MAASSPSLSSLSLSSIFKPKPLHLVAAHSPVASVHAPILAFSSTQPSTRKSYNLNLPLKPTKTWKTSAVDENFWLSEASPAENSQEIVATNDDGVSTIISALLFVAFIVLSILTIGVIYIAVTDFLQKREKDKFEKEEAAKKKKSGKKGKVRTRSRLDLEASGRRSKKKMMILMSELQ